MEDAQNPSVQTNWQLAPRILMYAGDAQLRLCVPLPLRNKVDRERQDQCFCLDDVSAIADGFKNNFKQGDGYSIM
jgi:hypothetical protein